ncbi:MAG: ribonuclease HII [Spirochaetaceae bacterium]|nr:ribonuclease HII [Spirochaetaceae bacterium]
MLCGLDEVGRGPLAGPVTAAAVILDSSFPVEILDDSKKLSEKKRYEAVPVIFGRAVAWGIGWVWPEEIDRINILKASLLAMKYAFEQLRVVPDRAIVDGIFAPDIPVVCTTMVKADSQIPAVMAASILAKTARDRMMERFSWLYPEYGYERHKGYPTKAHVEALELHGPSPIQRYSFKLKNKTEKQQR